MSNYDAIYSYWRGRTDAGAAASPTSSRQHSSDNSLSVSAAKIALERHYEPQILDLKQRLQACRSVREELRNALYEVAPHHPLVNPLDGNKILGDVAEEGAATVKHWDDDIG